MFNLHRLLLTVYSKTKTVNRKQKTLLLKLRNNKPNNPKIDAIPNYSPVLLERGKIHL
jgi:hypothetical protein